MNHKHRIACALAILLLISALSACARLKDRPTSRLPDPPSNIQHADPAGSYSQSPTFENLLAEMSPSIPANVADRLPVNPVRVPISGSYSGALRMLHDDYYSSTFGLYHRVSEQATELGIPLSVDQSSLLPSPQTWLWEPVMMDEQSTLAGNLFEEWRVENEGKTHFVTLREGMCWSDGTPVTVYDVKFALDLFASNEPFYRGDTAIEPRRSQVWGLRGDIYGNLPSIEVTGDFSCRITCASSDPGLPLRAAHAPNGYLDLLMPSAFLKTLHKDYTYYKDVWIQMRQMGVLPWPTEQEKRESMEKEGTDNPDPSESWAVLFWKVLDNRMGNKTYKYHEWAAQIPTLTAWMLPASFTSTIGEPDRYSLQKLVLTFIRNPYYHKVDEKGQQLPFYDKVDFYISMGDGDTFRRSWDADSTPIIVGLPKHWLRTYAGNHVMQSSLKSAYMEYATAYDYFSPILAKTLYADRWLNDDVENEEYHGIIQMGWDKGLRATIQQWQALEVVQTGRGLGLVFNDQRMDSDWQKAVADPAFRAAVSASIDRERIVREVSNGHAQPAAWISDAELPAAYKGLKVPVLLQLQDYMLYSDYDNMLNLIVDGLKSIGLDAYRMDEQALAAYHKGDVNAQPGLWLALTASEQYPNPFVLPIVPANWTNAATQTLEKEYADAVKALPGTAADELDAAWRDIGELVKKTVPYVPLVDNMQAYFYRAPALHGNSGGTVLEQYHSVACWWEDKEANAE